MAADDLDAQRARLRKVILTVIERTEPSTGLGVGPQAEKLADELVTALGPEGGRLAELATYESQMRAQLTTAVSDSNGLPRLRLAPDFRIEAADLASVLEVFDTTAPRLHPQLATELLTLARHGGAAGDVVAYLQLMADADLVEGVYTVTWPADSGLPGPGETVELDGSFPAPVQGRVQVVGFGRIEGSLRVRPLGHAERDELGPDARSEPESPSEGFKKTSGDDELAVGYPAPEVESTLVPDRGPDPSDEESL